jgi:hypothetical protein
MKLSSVSEQKANVVRKRAIFRGNKANIWFRMSHLSQQQRKNKANSWLISPEGAASSAPTRKTKPTGSHGEHSSPLQSSFSLFCLA